MPNSEILDADSRGNLIVQNAINDTGQDRQADDLEPLSDFCN